MRVLVDTPLWSLALRRKPEQLGETEKQLVASLKNLIKGRAARVIGPIRQEVLSGIRDAERFDYVRSYLRDFDEEDLSGEDFESAARVHNACAARGLAGSSIDFLICAVAASREWQVFTTDRDFEMFRRCVPIRLYVD